MKDLNDNLKKLIAHTVQVVPEEALYKKLKNNERLRVKLGADPTSPDLHLGHAVVLSKLKEFQDQGHEVIFIIGDFTARIGDPTGKSKTRPALSDEEIARNTATYFEQVARILDPKKVSIRFNSEWLDHLSSREVVRLCAKATLARLTEREDFAKRIEHHEPIGFHELLYPLFQGFDSVALKADVELGGTDQTVNLLMGRFIQEQYQQDPQVIITMPLLEGLDGKQKMSKSLNNYVALNDTPEDAYGKLMSISDQLMWRYMQVLLHTTDSEKSELQARVAYGTTHPMALKKQMAFDIIEKYWSRDEAARAQERFELLFQEKDYEQASPVCLPEGTANPLWIIELLKLLGAIESTSQGIRLIEEGAVRINDAKVKDFKETIHWNTGMTIRVGKHRIYRLAQNH
jgi:tyrosyl-tRNA synthetase